MLRSWIWRAQSRSSVRRRRRTASSLRLGPRRTYSSEAAPAVQPTSSLDTSRPGPGSHDGRSGHGTTSTPQHNQWEHTGTGGAGWGSAWAARALSQQPTAAVGSFGGGDGLLPHERAAKEEAARRAAAASQASLDNVRQNSRTDDSNAFKPRDRLPLPRLASRTPNRPWSTRPSSTANSAPIETYPAVSVPFQPRSSERLGLPSRDTLRPAFEQKRIRRVPVDEPFGASRKPATFAQLMAGKLKPKTRDPRSSQDSSFPQLYKAEPIGSFAEQDTESDGRQSILSSSGLEAPPKVSRAPKVTSSDSWAELENQLADQGTNKGKKNKGGPETAPTWGSEFDEMDKKRKVDAINIDIPLQGPRMDASEQLGRGDSTREMNLARNRKDRYRVFDAPKKRHPTRGRRSDRDDEEEEYDEEVAEERRSRRAERKAERARLKQEQLDTSPPILLPEFISVSNLAGALGVKPKQFLFRLEGLGFEHVTVESILSGETAALVAQEFGFTPSVAAGEAVDLKPRPPPEDPSSLPSKPPVVTIMGHVDHGKTTLLDWLRKSSVVDQEHGGITQHIGAFSVKLESGKQVTFLDTPGHAAFLSMRQRGANVTDIVILVVAADDSVKPQTVEALKHIRAAKVPMIVAITKVDKEDARIDRVKADLATNGVEIEDYGGDIQVVCVSGKTGQGMNELEENILTLSEILDLRAEHDGMAEGWILESSVKPIGRAATVLVTRGTLRQDDFIVAGNVWTKIRNLRSEAGEEIEEAPPGTAAEILGWNESPDAGDQMLQAPSENRARDASEYRLDLAERERAATNLSEQEKQKREAELEKAAAEAIASAAADGDAKKPADAEDTEAEKPGVKLVSFTVKGDVHGSVEAVCGAVTEIGSNEVGARILRSGTGQITEFDVDHAAISGSAIINFNNPIAGHIKVMADRAGVKILDHNIIYRLADEVKAVMSEHLPPIISTRVVGEAEVVQVFQYNVSGRVYKNVAGCRIRNGQIARTGKYRVMRGAKKVFEGKLDSLKNGKKSVSEMRKGTECGMSFEDWDDVKEQDQIQMFEDVIEKRHL